MKKKLRFLICIILCGLVIGTALRVGSNIVKNQEMRSGFVPNDRWPDYQEECPISEMDFEQYASCFIRAIAPIGYPTEFTNTSAIRYYEEKDGEYQLVYEIPAGTLLVWQDSEALGYGFMTFPTYDEEWRIGRPFRSTDASEEDGDVPWYYIKTEDLQDVALQVYESSKYLQTSAQIARLSKSEAVSALVLQTDRILYEDGVWLSPALMMPVWTWDCTLMAVVAAALMIILLSAVRKK